MTPAPRSANPVPDAQRQAQAQMLIRQTFKEEYADSSAKGRIALAERLLQEGIDTADDPAARYVLWRESRDLAASTGHAQLAWRAMEKLSAQFAIEIPTTSLAMLAAASRAATTPADSDQVAKTALVAAEQALALEDYDTALRLANLAQGAAQRAKHPTLIAAAQDRCKEIEAIVAESAAVKTALATLKDKPDDAPAHLRVGSFLCFTRCDWEGGLPHLSHSGDAALVALATGDLAAAAPAELHQQASRWWDLAQTRSGLARRHILAHAVALYRKALPSLAAGLTLDSARKRIELFDQEILKELGLAPGLSAHIHRGSDFGQLIRTRIDGQIDFDWGAGAPRPELPKDNFSIRWSGTLHLPQPGRYELRLIANAGAMVYLGDKLVLDGKDIARKTKGITAIVDCPGDLTPIRVDYWDTSGLAKVKLSWRTPLSSQEQVIPAGAFLHESNSDAEK